MILPFTMTATTPVVAIRWNGVNWYNSFVLPNGYRASGVCYIQRGNPCSFQLRGVIKIAEKLFVHALGNVAAPVIICLYTLFQVNKNLEKLATLLTAGGI